MRLIVFLPAVLILAVVASAATIGVDVGNIGPSLAVNVQITDVIDLYGFQFDFAFDPALLLVRLLRFPTFFVIEGDFLPSGGSTFFVPGAVSNSAGTITGTVDTLLGAVPGVSGSGTLVTIVFAQLASGTSPLTLSNVVVVDSAGNDIPVDVQSGSVNLILPEPNTGLLLGGAAALGLLLMTTPSAIRLCQRLLCLHGVSPWRSWLSSR